MKIALVGNQNSGKTTLFNSLTGLNSKIGNFPGVTIEKKTGIIKGTNHELTDLPGIYSLSPYTIEEEISRKFIFEENPDIIINIVDATCIERSLYLTTQLLELDCKMIIALNMTDLLEKKGLQIDIKKLEECLGVKIYEISALKEKGLDELIKAIDEEHKIIRHEIFDENINKTCNLIINELDKTLAHKKFIAIRLIDDDARFSEYKNEKISNLISNLTSNYDTDMEEIIATQRYNFTSQTKKLTTKQKQGRINFSDKLDNIFLNKFLAFPIFVIIMFLVYYLSVGVVGSYTVDSVNDAFDFFGEIMAENLGEVNTSKALISLVQDGIIAGVGAVLGFVPQLIILFLCISLLETTGYMSRVALLLDKFFRSIGLSGKSLIPFIIGSGCSVPAIMGSRIIENEDERKMTAILTPFIPCSAKLPIIALFAGYFFPQSAGAVSASLYFFSIIVIILSAILMKNFIFFQTSSTFIAELPGYKIPNAKYVARDVFEKTKAFIMKAGTIILLCSIVIWFLSSFSFGLKYGIDIEDSILAGIGNSISWIFYPILGTYNWGAAVSAIQGLIAKEQVISSMAVINGLADDVEEGAQIFAANGLFGFFTPASAYAFMVFNLFSAPCFGALGAMRKELGGAKRMLKAALFQTCFAWILASIVYQIGSRADNMANVIVASVIAIIVILILSSMFKRKKNLECVTCPYCDSCAKK